MNKRIWMSIFILGLICAPVLASTPSRIWYERVELPLFRKVIFHGQQEIPMDAEKSELRFWRCGMYRPLQSPGVLNYVVEEITGPKRKVQYFIRNDVYYGERDDMTLTPFNGCYQHRDWIILSRNDRLRISEDPPADSLTYVQIVSGFDVGTKQRARYVRYTSKGALAPTSEWQDLDLVQGTFSVTISQKDRLPPGQHLYFATYYRAPDVFRDVRSADEVCREGFIQDQHRIISEDKIAVLLRYPRNAPEVIFALELGPPPEDFGTATTLIKEFEVMGTDIIGRTFNVHVTEEEIRKAINERAAKSLKATDKSAP